MFGQKLPILGQVELQKVKLLFGRVEQELVVLIVIAENLLFIIVQILQIVSQSD